MAIREKLRAKFGKTKKNTSGDSTPSSVSTEGYYTGRTDIEYYQPHEIPKSKYRGKVDKEHQETLDSYSFGDAFQAIRRKTSMALSGTFSPGGTKAQSAMPSAAASRRTSWVSRNQSIVSSASEGLQAPTKDDATRRKSAAQIKPPTNANISENSDDDTDVANTGLSRIGTARDRPEKDQSGGNIPSIRLDREATVTESNPQLGTTTNYTHNTPFTIEELERAMTKATMKNTNDISALRRGSVAVC